jgi:Winged helix DNA-binding domain
VTTLITAYSHRYGPATIRDATWWSGLSASDVTAALRRSGRALITVATPWSAQPCLMFADQATEALASSALTSIRLLAHEDSALKAYQETRDRYLAGLPQQRAFNQIGEVLPTIVIDGTVVGTWSWDTRGRSVSPQVLPGKTTPALRRRIHKRAEGLTHTLRAGLNPPESRQAA